jgi:hypothetical protein
MSEFKGTKGKWILRENFCTIASNENNLLARVYDAKGNALHPAIEQDFKTVKANAKLIASAPEMLEMLVKLSTYISNTQEKNQVVIEIEQLIKKATE